MKLDIGGRQVEVDDSFNSLTPDRQQATVDEIQRSFQMEAEAKAKIAAETAKKETPVGMFDMSNSQSGIRQNVIDPLSTVASAAAEHPWLAAGAAAMLPNSVLEKIPGLNKIAAAKNVVSNLSSAAQGYAQNAASNQALAETAAAREARIAQRPGMGIVPKTAPTMAPMAPVAPSMAPNYAAAPSYAPAGAPSMAPGAMPTAPVAPAMSAMPPPLPATTPPPLPASAAPAQTVQQMAMDKLKMLGGLSQKVAPMLQGASRAIAPLAVAKELYYTSPEERAILQAAEDKKRAQGWKPLSERF